MKIQFLTPYPLKKAPSQRFRFEQYFHQLQQEGFGISSQSFWGEHTWAILYQPANPIGKVMGFCKGIIRRTAILFQLSEIDFVFVHRECLPLGPPIVEWILAKVLKKKIIYDFDDAIWLPNTSEENRLVAFLKWHRKVASICSWSYKVSTGNSFLANYARQFNKNVIINPTTIDTVNLHNPTLFPVRKTSTQIVIGWTGTQSTLPYIISLIPALEKLEAKFKGQVRFLIIANKDPQLGLPFIDFIPWRSSTEVEDLLKMDIGVMPLTDDAWAKGKCGFKALQYMALGIPALVSPVGVNTEIVEHGSTGFLCETETDWIQYLEKLMVNPSLRKEMGLAGRRRVEEHYSVSSNSSTVLGLFS